MQESLAAEHGGELLGDALEQLLDGGGVTDEGGGHLQAAWGNVTDSGLDIVGDPLDEVRRVLVLHVEHLLVDLLGRHAAAEERARGEVAAVARVAGRHDILGVEHLLDELGNGEGAVLLTAARCERSETRDEEVKTREGNHVYRQFSKISVQLTWD